MGDLTSERLLELLSEGSGGVKKLTRKRDALDKAAGAGPALDPKVKALSVRIGRKKAQGNMRKIQKAAEKKIRKQSRADSMEDEGGAVNPDKYKEMMEGVIGDFLARRAARKAAKAPGTFSPAGTGERAAKAVSQVRRDAGEEAGWRPEKDRWLPRSDAWEGLPRSDAWEVRGMRGEQERVRGGRVRRFLRRHHSPEGRDVSKNLAAYRKRLPSMVAQRQQQQARGSAGGIAGEPVEKLRSRHLQQSEGVVRKGIKK